MEHSLLMLGLHVGGIPELRKQADQWFTRSWRGRVNLTCDIATDLLKELNAKANVIGLEEVLDFSRHSRKSIAALMVYRDRETQCAG